MFLMSSSHNFRRTTKLDVIAESFELGILKIYSKKYERMAAQNILQAYKKKGTGTHLQNISSVKGID